MDKSAWTSFLIFATASILVLSAGSLATARPRHQVLVPFLPSLVVSVAIYPAMVEDASSFHRAFVVCALLALAFALFLTRHQPERNRLATFSWALLGVVVPYLVFFAFLTAICWGHTECLG